MKIEYGKNPVETTHSFVKEFLNPQPNRYDRTYRYEHTLWVAQWGKKIAEGEVIYIDSCFWKTRSAA